MSLYLKTLGLHIYLATTKKSYIENDKYLEANAQAMIVQKQTLRNAHLFMISHYGSTFVVWNTLIFPEGQVSNDLERASSDDDSDQACFIVQKNDSPEVNSKSNIEVWVHIC